MSENFSSYLLSKEADRLGCRRHCPFTFQAISGRLLLIDYEMRFIGQLYGSLPLTSASISFFNR